MYGAFPVCRNYTVRAQLRFAVAGKRRAPQADSGLAGTQRFFYHGEYLRPSGLQLQAVLSAGDGERNAPAGNGGFRQQMGRNCGQQQGGLT